MNRLERVRIAGFKSLASVDLELRDLNVFIGANGAGKSNLISFFTLLNYLSSESLQVFVGREGGANSLLHYGSKRTPEIEAGFQFRTDDGSNEYRIRLVHAAADTLIFADETTVFHREGKAEPRLTVLGAGHRETKLPEKAAEEGPQGLTPRLFLRLLRRYQVFHFHDTTRESEIRGRSRVDSGFYLRSRGQNLAAFLLRLQNEKPAHYRRIVDMVRFAAPFFDDFHLQPEGDSLLLRWRERDAPDYVLGPHQLSDGTLRIIALFALLLQPAEQLPDVIVIDEPELGLHPAALHQLGGLLQSASTRCQVIVATQSAALLDSLRPEDVVVVSKAPLPAGLGSATAVSRLDEEKLRAWLEEYSLGQLWGQNVLGGKPDWQPA